MKTLLAILAIVTLTSTSFAADTQKKRPGKRPGKKKHSLTIVKGKRAEAIFTALDAEIVTKNRDKFSADIKKVASLKCSKLTKKEDTTVVKYRCSLKGKKSRRGQVRGDRPRRGQGRDARRGRGQQRRK